MPADIKKTRDEPSGSRKELMHRKDAQQAVHKHRQKKRPFEDRLLVENLHLASGPTH